MDNKTFFERTGAILIVVCILALIGAFGYSYYLAKNKDIQSVTVNVVVPVDSTGVMDAETAKSIEALKAELQRHEQLLEDRYKHVLEQKEDMNDLLSIGGMFLAVVLGIFGFFGYKSTNSIEEKVKKEAESVAEETSRKKLDNMEEHVEASVIEQANAKIVTTLDRNMAEYKVTAKRQVEAIIQKKVKDSIQQVGDMQKEVDALTTSMGNLDQKIAQLSDRVEGIQAQTARPNRGRHTLANGGSES